MRIDSLRSGGIIVSYRCSNCCGHCLYRSSPRRARSYVECEELFACLETMRGLGCKSAHIGGGEPFLRRKGLRKTLECFNAAGVRVEYVETNGVWYANHAQAVRYLNELKEVGLRQILLSISPFHNAWIPFAKTKGVLAACKTAGIDVLPWLMDFYADLDALDPQKVHDFSEYQERYGQDYLCRFLKRSWTHLGGRALKTFRACFRRRSAEELLVAFPNGCRELENTDHFHFDLYGNFIPGLCVGLSIRRQDLGRPLDPEAYPLVTTLHEQGIAGLLELARSGFDFVPDPEGYISKCDLCSQIRFFLTREKRYRSIELKPDGFYRPDCGR